MKILPVFKYYDASISTVGNPITNQEFSRLAQQLYIFSKEEKTNEVLLKNMANGVEEVLVLDIKSIKNFLLKKNLIN